MEEKDKINALPESNSIEILEKKILLKELNITKIKLIIVALLSFAFLAATFALSYIAIHDHYELEQERLELARYQFEVQADQSNRSIKLQEANEAIKLFEKLMNSGLLKTAANDVLGAPREVSNAAKDLAVELIRTLRINVNCTPRWICDNKDPKSAKIPANSSATECHSQNTPTKSLWAGNNNRENICFECRYMNLDTWQIPDSYSNPRGTS